MVQINSLLLLKIVGAVVLEIVPFYGGKTGSYNPLVKFNMSHTH